MTFAINMAGNSGKGDWPVSGGMLEQAAWFMDLRQTLIADQNAIEREKSE